jgi:hypothetical protein
MTLLKKAVMPWVTGGAGTSLSWRLPPFFTPLTGDIA